MTLSLPAGALDSPARIEIRRVYLAPGQTELRVPVGPAIAIGPADLFLAKPALLAIAYDARLGQPHGLHEGDVVIRQLEEGESGWISLPSEAGEGVVRTSVTDPGTFQPTTADPSPIQAWTAARVDPAQGIEALVDLVVVAMGGWYGGHTFVATAEGELMLTLEQRQSYEGLVEDGVFVPPLVPQPPGRIRALAFDSGWLLAAVEDEPLEPVSAEAPVSDGPVLEGRIHAFDLRAPTRASLRDLEGMDRQVAMVDEFRRRTWLRIAGGGTALEEGARQRAARFGPIGAIAVTGDGAIYLAEEGTPVPGFPTGDRIRRIRDGRVATIAGNDTGFDGDAPNPRGLPPRRQACPEAPVIPATVGARGRDTWLLQPRGIAHTGDALVIVDACHSRLLVMPMKATDLAGPLSVTIYAGGGEYDAIRLPALASRLQRPVAVRWDARTQRILAVEHPD